jgi:hypothetical protein
MDFYAIGDMEWKMMEREMRDTLGEESVLLAVVDGTRNMYLNVEGRSQFRWQGAIG